MLSAIQAVFRRYLRPDKDYLSFSLIYNYGKRSLDLVGDDFFVLVMVISIHICLEFELYAPLTLDLQGES